MAVLPLISLSTAVRLNGNRITALRRSHLVVLLDIVAQLLETMDIPWFSTRLVHGRCAARGVFRRLRVNSRTLIWPCDIFLRWNFADNLFLMGHGSDPEGGICRALRGLLRADDNRRVFHSTIISVEWRAIRAGFFL